MNIIIFGPQGAGKGTQAKKIAQKFGLFHFSTGELIREAAKTRPDIDEKINKEGQLLPDEETLEMVSSFLEEKDMFDNVIFDGFPRTKNQYKLLVDFLHQKGTDIDNSIFLEISEKESIRRLTARRTDKDTGKNYNLVTNPPGPEVKRENLIQRPDDNEATIKTRLDVYRKNTLPLVEMLREKGRLIDINGERPIDVIFEDIILALKNQNE